MNPSQQTLESTLKSAGQSLTAPRKVVFDALLHKEPQTMGDVIAACSGRVNRASIYRTISLFEQLGIVHRLPHGWKYRLELTDAFHTHHHHLTCSRCGTTATLPEDPELERRLGEIAAEQGYTITGHQLEVQGLCATCNA